ncbi:MAG: DUF86 domain-containing protein [Candidatus Thorarchaeota archaeon]
MDAQRRARYKTKIKYILESMRIIDQLIPEPDEIQTRALYYIIFTSIESTMDLVAMFIKDRGGIPKGDKSNIDFLEAESYIQPNISKHLKKCNGLRNVLVHQYNGIDREIILRSVSDVRTTMTQLVVMMEEYLDES